MIPARPESPPRDSGVDFEAVAATSGQLSKIEDQIDRMLALCDAGRLGASAPRISGWTVGHQIDHLSKTGSELVEAVHTALDTGSFAAYATNAPMTLTGRVLLRAGWIPRGVAKAPKSVTPETKTDPQAVRARLDRIRERIGSLHPRLGELNAVRCRRKHPYFGGLTPATWIRFLVVHQHHHLKIVRDILRTSAG